MVLNLNDGAGMRMYPMPSILMTRTTFMRFTVRVALTVWHLCTLCCVAATFSRASGKRNTKLECFYTNIRAN